MLLEKAIIFSFIENNQRENGEIFFRCFNQHFSDLIISRNPIEYKILLNNYLLPAIADGQTNIEKALLQAVADIKENTIDTNYTEILLVTDGLSSINKIKIIEALETIKVHVIIIGNTQVHLSESEIQEIYKQQQQFEMALLNKKYS